MYWYYYFWKRMFCFWKLSKYIMRNLILGQHCVFLLQKITLKPEFYWKIIKIWRSSQNSKSNNKSKLLQIWFNFYCDLIKKIQTYKYFWVLPIVIDYFEYLQICWVRKPRFFKQNYMVEDNIPCPIVFQIYIFNDYYYINFNCLWQSLFWNYCL